MTLIHSAKTAIVGMLAAAALTGTAMTASANGADRATASGKLYQTYVWHAERKAQAKRPMVKASAPVTRRYTQTYFNGRSAFICSPSGSGQRSFCFSR